MKNKEDIYSEVYCIVNKMDEDYINKLPNKLREFLENNRNNNYNPDYNGKTKLSEQGVSREAMSLIALIYLNYWCKTDDERKELNKKLIDNEKIFQEKQRKLYNPDDLFEKNVNEKDNIIDINKNEKLPTVPKKEKWYKKIFNKLKTFFRLKKD